MERHAEIEHKESKRSQDIQESPREDGPKVVLSVVQRRRWLHYLRTKEDQDEALADYKQIDSELTLDWTFLKDDLNAL